MKSGSGRPTSSPPPVAPPGGAGGLNSPSSYCRRMGSAASSAPPPQPLPSAPSPSTSLRRSPLHGLNPQFQLWSPRLRIRDERKRVLKLSLAKLRRIDDPESCLCRSVLLNNTLRKLQREARDEKNSSYYYSHSSSASSSASAIVDYCPQQSTCHRIPKGEANSISKITK